MTLPRPDPLTRAESSGYEQTSTHADVLAFTEGLRIRGDIRLRVADFGQTPEGRLLPLLILPITAASRPRMRLVQGSPSCWFNAAFTPVKWKGKRRH
jgi:hypothetical protein